MIASSLWDQLDALGFKVIGGQPFVAVSRLMSVVNLISMMNGESWFVK